MILINQGGAPNGSAYSFRLHRIPVINKHNRLHYRHRLDRMGLIAEIPWVATVTMAFSPMLQRGEKVGGHEIETATGGHGQFRQLPMSGQGQAQHQGGLLMELGMEIVHGLPIRTPLHGRWQGIQPATKIAAIICLCLLRGNVRFAVANGPRQAGFPSLVSLASVVDVLI